MHIGGAINQLNIESIAESVAEDAASELIVRLLDYVFSNLGIIAIMVIILFGLFCLIILKARHKGEKRLLKELRQLFKEKDLELDQMMLSDVFRDLESGFIQGNTKDILIRLEQRLLASHQYSEQLQRKLDKQKIPLFSMIAMSDQMVELQGEVYAFAEQVDLYASELMGIQTAAKQTAGIAQPLQQKYAELAKSIERIAEKTSYPLDALRKLQRQVEADVNRAVQSGSFDALRAKADVQKANKAIDYLDERTVKLEKDIGLFRQMKLKVKEQASTLPEEVSIKLEERMQKLENNLKAGAEVNLRAEAIEIEKLYDRK